MKTKSKKLLFGISAIMLIFTMIAVGCDNGSGGGGGGGNSAPGVTYQSAGSDGSTYILAITPNTAKYTVKEGDDYVLTIKKSGTSDKVSKGTVSSVGADGALELQPKEGSPFNVSISDGKMTAINGPIAIEGGDPVSSPGTLTPQQNNNNNNNDNSGGSASFGSTLKITNAQVYSVSYVGANYTPQFTEFTGSVSNLIYVYWSSGESDYGIKSLSELIDGNPSVSITSGKLNITLGKPKASSMQNLNTSGIPSGITVSATNVNALILQQGFFNNATNPTARLMQGQTDENQGGMVMYMYVDKDVNISGQSTSTDDYGTDITTYAMNLKAGWNSVYSTSSYTETSFQSTIKSGTPPDGYKWVIEQQGYEY